MKSFNNKMFGAWAIFLLSLSVIQSAQATTEDAANYLSSTQQVSHYYISSNTLTTDFQSTSEVIRALRFFGETTSPNVDLAQGVLESTPNLNSEYLSRLIVLKQSAQQNTAALISEIEVNQNVDGGFGGLKDQSSSILDTAFVLEALSTANIQSVRAANAVTFLLSQQNIDGSWGDELNHSNVYLTALAMRSLWYYKSIFSDVSTTLTSAQIFLLSQRQVNTGLWQETHESALALIALIPNVNEFSQVESMVTDLADQQLLNGSWNNDVYVTALVLRALLSKVSPKTPVLTTGSISGKIINSDTALAVVDAAVSINGISTQVTTDSEGKFSFDGISAGSYELVISANGYSAVNISGVQVSVGVDTGLDSLMLSPLPTTGILQGKIVNAVTLQPINDATILVAGNVVSSTVSAANGQYSIGDLSPGVVNITISKNGFQPVVASANVLAGGSLVFNPVLKVINAESQPLPATDAKGQLRGVVSDSSTGLPLQSVAVRVVNSTNNRTVGLSYTSLDGSYLITNLEPAQIKISMMITDYQSISLNAEVSAGHALLFSPGLVPIGNDPSTGTGSIAQETLPGTSATGVLRGVITDFETSLPLGGVSVDVTGSLVATVLTATDGSYLFADVPPGNVSINTNKNGYLSINATGVVIAGSALVFNTKLVANTSAGNENGKLIGSVIDASTQNSISRVLVRVVGDQGETTTLTSWNTGLFEIADVAPGVYHISIEKQGYVTQGFSTVVTSGGTVDFQSIELTLALDHVAVYGQLLDATTSEPIANAVVSVSGSLLSVETNAQGGYRLENLATGDTTISFSATGYSTQTLIFNFNVNGEFEQNRRLNLASNSSINLTYFGVNQNSYPAYSPVSIIASVNNAGSPIEAMAVFSLFNEQEVLISEYVGKIAGLDDALITFPSNQVTEIVSNFNTANLPPGTYRLVARIVVGNQLIGPATVILSEKTLGFNIEPTKKVSELKIDVIPSFSSLGSTEEISLIATALNRSNVPITVRLRYQLLSSDGVLIKSANSISLDLSESSDSIVTQIDSFTHLFTTSGKHVLDVSYQYGGVRPDQILGDEINVAPGLRIDLNQSVTPQTVTPDENKRIKINIQLQGMEVQ